MKKRFKTKIRFDFYKGFCIGIYWNVEKNILTNENIKESIYLTIPFLIIELVSEVY